MLAMPVPFGDTVIEPALGAWFRLASRIAAAAAPPPAAPIQIHFFDPPPPPPPPPLTCPTVALVFAARVSVTLRSPAFFAATVTIRAFSRNPSFTRRTR